ncbi:MAG: thioesterase family protein [Actinomycetota bacterium]
MDEPFYQPLGNDLWGATVHTTGPWDARFQHGGPPSALLGRAIERCNPREDMFIARLEVDILGAVPVGELTLRSRVLRPGRSVELVEAALSAGGREVARAQAWRVLRTPENIAPRQSPTPAAPTAPVAPPMATTSTFSVAEGWIDGYLSAVEWRFTAGEFGQPGPATAWTRLRHPIVPDETPSPLQRVLAVADSGNGISSELDLNNWHFINPELTVHLHREAVGEWICVEAQTAISPGGAGLATSVLSDAAGPIGVGAQSLLIAPR